MDNLTFDKLDLERGLENGYPFTKDGTHVTPESFPDNFLLTGERVYFKANNIPSHITGRVGDFRDDAFNAQELFSLAGLVETSTAALFEIGLKEQVQYGRSVPFVYDSRIVDGRELTLESITRTTFDNDEQEVHKRKGEIKQLLDFNLVEYVLREEQASFREYLTKKRNVPLSDQKVQTYLDNRGLAKTYLTLDQQENPRNINFTQLSPEQKQRVMNALPHRLIVRWQKLTDLFLTNLWLEHREYAQNHLKYMTDKVAKLSEGAAKDAEKHWLAKGIIAFFPEETILEEEYNVRRGMLISDAESALNAKLTPFQKLLGPLIIESSLESQLETQVDEENLLQRIRVRFGPGMNDYHVVILPKNRSVNIGVEQIYSLSAQNITASDLDKLKAAVFVAGKAIQEWMANMYQQKANLAHGQEEMLRGRSDRTGDKVQTTVKELQEKLAAGTLKPDELADALAKASKQVRRIGSELGHAGSEADLYKHAIPRVVDRRQRSKMKDGEE